MIGHSDTVWRVRTWTAYAIGAAIAVALGASITIFTPSVSACLVVIISVVLLSWPTVRLAQGRFDVLEPIVWLNGALAVMFVVRPIADLVHGRFRWHEFYDITPTFNHALIVGLVGSAALQLGYAAPHARRLALRIRPLPAELREDALVSSAGLFAVLGIGAYGFYARSVHLSFGELVRGGIAGGGSTAYLYLAPFMIIPAALLLMDSGLRRRTRALVVCALVLVALLTNSLAPAGQRLWLMLLLLTFLIYPMLRNAYRPSLLLIILVVVPTFFFAVAMRDVGGANGAPGFWRSADQAWTHPTRAFNELTLGADTEMFDALAVELQVVPKTISYQPGATLLNLSAAPMPRLLWPSKPRQTDDRLNSFLFAEHGYQVGRAGAAYSALGGFYYDGGLIAVVVWMMVIGMLFRALFEYLRANTGNDSVNLLYAAALPFAVVLMRGNVQDTLSRALFVVLPLVIAIRRSQRESPVRMAWTRRWGATP